MADGTEGRTRRAAPARQRRLGGLLPVWIAFGTVLAGIVAYVLLTATDDQDRFRLTVVPHRPQAAGFSLAGSDGRAHTLADYRGRVVLLFFGFTHCPDACPTELYKLSQVVRRLGGVRGRVQVLMVTLDPARDTAPLLRRYVTTFDPSFIGLTGPQRDIDQAEAGYGVISRRVPVGGDYTIEHTTAIYVIDAAGRERLVGTMATGVDDFVHDLQQILT